MSTITAVGTGTAATGNNVSVTAATPSFTQVADLVLIFASIRNSGTGVPVQPSGWATLALFGNTAVFARFWQTGDTMPAVAFTGGAAGADTIAQSAAFRGVSQEVLALVTATTTQLNGSGATVPYPLFTAGKDRHLLVLAAWMQAAFTSASTPAGMNTLTSASSSAGSGAAQVWFRQIQTTAATISAGSLTITGGSSAISRAVWLALKPAASITAVQQDVYPPRVLVSVTDLTLGDAIAVYRSVAGTRTLVQGGSAAAVTDPSFLRVDGTLPFGVPVSYVAVVNGVEYATSAVTYTLPGGKVVVSDAVTALAAEVVIWAWPEKQRERQASIFRPGGRNVVVSGELSLPTSDVELYTDAYSSTLQLVQLIENATQAIVQIRQPGGYDGVDGFYAVIGYRERRWSQDGSDDKRIHVLSLVEVDGWASAFTALGFTYGDLATVYTGLTYANVAADFATYLLLSQGDFS